LLVDIFKKTKDVLKKEKKRQPKCGASGEKAKGQGRWGDSVELLVCP
jgi:hypothetical protein